jgi:hypothetical protein
MRAIRTPALHVSAPILAFALLFVCAAAALAAEVSAPEPGRIDWLGLAAIGEAVPDAGPRRAALAARKHLLAALTHVQIRADLNAADRLARDRRAADRLRVLALSSPARSVQSQADGAVVLRAVLALRGEALELLLPRASQFNTGLAPRIALPAEPAEKPAEQLERAEQDLVALKSRPSVGDRPLESFAPQQGPGAAEAVPAIPALPEADAEHSGLIVDARGTGATRALLPVLYDEAGVGLYGAFAVARAGVVRQGLVVYARDVDDAALRARVGEKPLVVKAAGPVRESGPDLRLAAPEARAVRALLRAKSVPARCAVVILTD